MIGITPSMVAWNEPGQGVTWNRFSAFSRRTIIASTYQLRDFAAETKRPFEEFLGAILVAQLFVAKFYPKVGFHDDNGCLFDYCDDRVSIKKQVEDLKIEPGMPSRDWPAYSGPLPRRLLTLSAILTRRTEK